MTAKALTGGSSDYYKVLITNPTTPGGTPYNAECNDIIEALGMTYAEGNAFKAIWRSASARLGNGKPGNTALYDAEKVEFFGGRMVAQAKTDMGTPSSPAEALTGLTPDTYTGGPVTATTPPKFDWTKPCWTEGGLKVSGLTYATASAPYPIKGYIGGNHRPDLWDANGIHQANFMSSRDWSYLDLTNTPPVQPAM